MKVLSRFFSIAFSIGAFLYIAPPAYSQPDNMFVNYINFDDQNDVRIYDAYDAGDIIALTGIYRLRQVNTSVFWLCGMSPEGNVAWQETYFPADE